MERHEFQTPIIATGVLIKQSPTLERYLLGYMSRMACSWVACLHRPSTGVEALDVNLVLFESQQLAVTS